MRRNLMQFVHHALRLLLATTIVELSVELLGCVSCDATAMCVQDIWR